MAACFLDKATLQPSPNVVSTLPYLTWFLLIMDTFGEGLGPSKEGSSFFGGSGFELRTSHLLGRKLRHLSHSVSFFFVFNALCVGGGVVGFALRASCLLGTLPLEPLHLPFYVFSIF
jgi:hypothetical protein